MFCDTSVQISFLIQSNSIYGQKLYVFYQFDGLDIISPHKSQLRIWS